MDCSSRAFEFARQGLGIPTTWPHDEVENSQEPAQPLALACSSFGIGPTLGHRRLWKMKRSGVKECLFV